MRPRRACLPSPDREAYVQAALDRGCTELTARTKNRYIDEFLRYCDDHAGHHRANKVTEPHLQAFAKHLYESSWQWNTAHTKLSEALIWLRWLTAEGRIRRDPGQDLSPNKMLQALHDQHHRHAMEVSLKMKRRKNDRESRETSIDDIEWDDW